MLAAVEPLRKVWCNGWGLGGMRRRLLPRAADATPIAWPRQSLRMGQALAMGDADYRKPLTPAQLIEQLERSNPTVIAQVLSNDAQITLHDRLLLRAWFRPRSATEPLQ